MIDGEVVPSIDGQTMPVIDPATGDEVGPAALGSAFAVDRAVRSARAAFDDGRWRYLAPLEKERRMRRMSTLLAERATLFGESDTIDSGLLRWYTDAMVQFALDSIDYFSAGRRRSRARSRRFPPTSSHTTSATPMGSWA